MDATRRYPPPAGPDPTRRFGTGPGGPQVDGPGDGVLGGRYRLEGRIGAGGMADVHQAADLRLQRPVAVKIFRAGADPDDERRFHQEAWTLANLNHPGLVALHDFAVEDHRAFLVMELIEGPTLADVLARERLPPQAITRIGVEVADVLAYIHGQGVVHRDVKPSNLLLDRDGRIRLADFGISRLVGTAMTSAGATAGTAAYASPEQVQGGPVGPPADVYALGLVLLEAATGRREYPGEGWDAAAARLSTPPAVPHGLPDPLRRTLDAMTAADPARRPTARQVTDMLPGDLPGDPVDDEPVEQEPERRGRALTWALALVAFLAVLAAIVLATADDEDPTAAPAAPPGTAENGDDGSGGIELPEPPSFQAPELPDVPELPDTTDLPELPEVPDTVADDAQGLWQQFTEWLSEQF